MEKSRCSRPAPRDDYLVYLGGDLGICILFYTLGDFDAKAKLGLMVLGKKCVCGL